MLAPFARIDRQTLTTGGEQSQPATTPIAYIMSRFPKLSETFILRELLELERQGQPVVIFPLLRSKETVHHHKNLQNKKTQKLDCSNEKQEASVTLKCKKLG